MAVSILHRATGSAMAAAGGLMLVWWLTALASGSAAYAVFVDYVVRANAGEGFAHVTNILARLAAIGLSWAFLQHLCSGVRHLILDMGAGYELRTAKLSALATLLVSVSLTVILWLLVLTGGF